MLTLSESYYQTRVNTFFQRSHQASNMNIFRELLSNNTTHFSRAYIKQYWHFLRMFLANNTTHFSRVYTKQYWHSHRVPSKLNYSKKFFSEFISNNTDTFRELLPNNIDIVRAHIKQYSLFTELLPDNSKHFFESFNGNLNRQKIRKEKIPK